MEPEPLHVFYVLAKITNREKIKEIKTRQDEVEPDAQMYTGAGTYQVLPLEGANFRIGDAMWLHEVRGMTVLQSAFSGKRPSTRDTFRILNADGFSAIHRCSVKAPLNHHHLYIQ